MQTRRHFLGMLGLAAITGRASRAFGKEPKRVLFICTGNFYRSRFAQAAFNEQAPAGWTAISRGLDVSTPRTTPVSPLVITELERRKIDVARVSGTPTALTRKDLDSATVVVLLDGNEHEPILAKQFPDYPKAKIRSWSVQDAPKMAPADAFSTMWDATQALITELGKPHTR